MIRGIVRAYFIIVHLKSKTRACTRIIIELTTRLCNEFYTYYFIRFTRFFVIQSYVYHSNL
jgi:hypothetical protein